MCNLPTHLEIFETSLQATVPELQHRFELPISVRLRGGVEGFRYWYERRRVEQTYDENACGLPLFLRRDVG